MGCKVCLGKTRVIMALAPAYMERVRYDHCPYRSTAEKKKTTSYTAYSPFPPNMMETAQSYIYVKCQMSLYVIYDMHVALTYTM